MAKKKVENPEVVEEAAAPAEAEAPKKKTRKAKEEAPAAPAKEPRTEARATATNVRITPRKARLVIDQVRGKDNGRSKESYQESSSQRRSPC